MRREAPVGQLASLAIAALIDARARRSAFSLFRCNVYWEVPGENFARAFSVLLIIEAIARGAACKSSRVKLFVSSVCLFINADAIRNALRLSRSIECCHVPRASFRWALADLLMSEAIGRSASCDSLIFAGEGISKFFHSFPFGHGRSVVRLRRIDGMLHHMHLMNVTWTIRENTFCLHANQQLRPGKDFHLVRIVMNAGDAVDAKAIGQLEVDEQQSNIRID